MQRGDSRGRGRGAGGNGGGRGGGGRGGGNGDRGGRGGGDRGGSSYRGGRGGDRGGGGYRGGGGGDRGGGGYRGGGGGDRGGGDYRGGGGGGRGGGGNRGGGGGRGRGGGGGEPTGPVIYTPERPGSNQADPQIVAAGNKLVTIFKTTKDDDELPLRPGYGTAGTAISIRANHFAIKIPKGPFYEYKVYFQPEVKIRRVRKRLLDILETAPQFAEFKPFVAHDGSEKLVSAMKLPAPDNGPLDVSVQLFDEDSERGPDAKSKTYLISLSFTGDITAENVNEYLNGSLRKFNIAPLLSALNIILAKHASTAGVKVGRDRYFFKGAGGNMDLGGGLEAWKGFYSSVRPTVNTLMVNVNVCYTTFYKEQNLATALREFSEASHGGNANKFVQGIRVQPTHLSYRPKKTVRRLDGRSADDIKFKCDELGGTVSVRQYFEKKYKKRILQPRWVVDLGTKEKPNLVPAELCEIIPNQSFKGKLADYNTANMINYACRSPGDNGRSIGGQGLGLMGFNAGNNEALKSFGVSISPDMAVIPARVLSPPRVGYAQNQFITVDPAKASWNMVNRRFNKGMRLDNWGIFVIMNDGRDDFAGPDDPAFNHVKQQFERCCAEVGIATSPCGRTRARNLLADPNRSIYNTLLDGLQGFQGMNYVLVLLSGPGDHIYAAVKHICDIKLGIPATCAHVGKIKGAKPAYMTNLALKINAKLGGVNHILDTNSASWLNRELTMLVGMDVTHPGPSSVNGTPSIAAVVASYDPDYTLYPASLRLQESRKEMIDDLAKMMSERLMFFLKKRKKLPSRVIVFRDGVSEGQFTTVLREEYPKFLDAFKRVAPQAGGKYRPKLTILICGKRHHTRFFPMDATTGDQLGNPKPGTVVDRGVTAVYEFDFFLQAHAGLKGSARPTHYTVIHDENKFEPDAIQGLINSSSYIFARATKAVSLVPPAYYADLACERGRYYLHNLLAPGPGAQTSSTSEVDKVAQSLWGEGIHKNIENSMFYI